MISFISGFGSYVLCMYVQLVMINLFHKLLNAVVQADVFFLMDYMLLQPLRGQNYQCG